MSGYDRTILPVPYVNTSLSIQFGLYIQQIIKIVKTYS